MAYVERQHILSNTAKSGDCGAVYAQWALKSIYAQTDGR